jgi:hypothetical protein
MLSARVKINFSCVPEEGYRANPRNVVNVFYKYSKQYPRYNSPTLVSIRYVLGLDEEHEMYNGPIA